MNKTTVLNFLKNKQNKETIWASLSKLIFIFAGVFFMYFIPNHFGIEVYGKFNLFFAYISLTQLFFGGFFINSIKKEVTENKFSHKSAQYFLELIKITAVSFLVSSVALVIILQFFTISVIQSYLLLFLLAMFSITLWNISALILQYTHRLFYVFILYGVEYVTKVLLLTLLLTNQVETFESLLTVFIIGYLLSGFLGFCIIIKQYHSKSRTTNKKSSVQEYKNGRIIRNQILARSFFLGTTILSGILLSKIDVIMISFFLDLSHVGHYSLAAEFTKKASVVSLPIIMGVVPLFVSNKGKQLFNRTIKKLILINGAAFICFLLFGRIIFQLLYGPGFESSILVLYILALMPLLMTLQSFNQQIMILKDAVESVLYFSLISVVVNIALNVILISLIGISGAAIATVISYSIWVLLGVIKLRRMKIW